MSAFARHPRRKLYEQLAETWNGTRRVLQLTPISPQNRRVRFAVDLALARQGHHPNTETRQQRRWIARLK